MDVTQLALTWVEWPNGDKLAWLRANLISTKWHHMEALRDNSFLTYRAFRVACFIDSAFQTWPSPAFIPAVISWGLSAI